MAKDYYAVLGLARGADDVVIHAAWRALLRKYHPDTNAGAEAQARAREINEAFAVLGKPQSRAAYDRIRGGAPPPPRPANSYRQAQPPPNPSHARQPQAKQHSTQRPAPGRSSVMGRPPRRAALVLLALVAVPGAMLLYGQFPDTLIDLRDRLDGYGGADSSTATLAPVGYTADEALGADVPPPIDPAAVTAATTRAIAIVHKGGVSAAARVSRSCDAAARDWPALDACIAFDIAVSLADASTPRMLQPPDPYFVLTAQRDSLRLEQLDRNPARAANRMSAIRAIVMPRAMTLLVGQDIAGSARPSPPAPEGPVASLRQR